MGDKKSETDHNSDDEDDIKEHRKQSRRQRRQAAATAPNDPFLQIGLSMCALVILLYGYSVCESAQSLPDLPTLPPEHMGADWNWNLAHLTEGQPAASIPQLRNGATLGEGPKVPPVHWPVSIRNEDTNFETIVHPGDGVTTLSVPKFWSPPLHNNQIFPRERAMQVGSCIEPDANGNHARGDDCPVHQRTIFVAIASYRDFQCRYTVESIFSRAKHPDRIRIGVVDQVVDGEDVVCHEPIQPCDQDPHQALCKYKDFVDVYEMEAELSIGPVFARHIGHRMYRGEYYATQSDAHVTYTQDWDADIIDELEQTQNEMAVLTTYLTDVQGSIDENGHSLRNTRPIMCNTYYEGGVQGMHLRHGSQPEREPSIHGVPQLQPWWAAGYSFSRGHFVVNVPYDPLQPMIFQGEEMSIGLRGWTIGYDYYAPERSVCFHHYAVGKNAAVRNKVKHFWENGDKYPGTGKKAMARLLGIVHMNPEEDPANWDHTDEDIYGLGAVRTPEKFYEIFGIDVVQKKVEHHLCQFVHEGGKMHKLFTPLIRKDRMGIDYSTVDYKFVDPTPNAKNFK